LFEIKPYLLLVEGKEDEEFFRWLFWEENDVEIRSTGGKTYQLATGKILEDVINPKKWIVIQDRNYRPGWEKIVEQEEVLVKTSEEDDIFVLKWTEIENIYFFFLKSLDEIKFTEVKEFISNNLKTIRQIVYTKICKSLLSWKIKTIWNRKSIDKCNFELNLPEAEDQTKLVFEFLNKNEENIYYVLPMKDIFNAVKIVTQFDYIGFVRKKVGIGLGRLHEDKDRLRIRERLIKLLPVKSLVEEIKKELFSLPAK